MNYSDRIGPKTWWNGELRDTKEATVHISAHSLHYGLGVFEGIRAYETEDGKPGIFRLQEHMKRFNDSLLISQLPQQYSVEDLVKACADTVLANGLTTCYLRPISFLGAGPLGVAFDAKTHPFITAIMAMRWGAYLGDDVMKNGARIKISSYTRHHPNVSMTKAKITGHYVNSILAKMEAKQAGFDEGLLLDPEGYVAEGSGENIFVIKQGRIFTPSVESVLDGITRNTIVTIFERELKMPVRERRMSRDELYAADEIFFCGTAAEVTPIGELDYRKIGSGKPGELTREVSRIYFDIVKGRHELSNQWVYKVQ